MAWTVTKTGNTTFGNMHVWYGTVTADSGSDVVSFGFRSLYHAGVTIKSMASALSAGTQANFALNVLTAGTASQGDLSVTGVTSGDVFYLMVYGR